MSGKGKTVHGEAANAGHRVLAPDDAEVEAYLETALNAPGPDRAAERPARDRRQRGRRRRPRLRQPVRAAHRAPRPRAQRLLGAAARTTRRSSELERRGASADHPLGRPELGLRRRRARSRTPRSGAAASPCSASATARSSWPTSSAATSSRPRSASTDPATVTIGDRGRAVRRPRSDAAGLDEPRRLDHGAAGGLQRHGPDRFDPVRRPRRPVAQPVRHPVPPRGRAHAARPGRPAQLRRRARRASRPTWTPAQLHRVDRRRDPASASTPTPATVGIGRQGHLRAVGRRRLGRRRGARPPGRRRPADVHLRRPRADAEARIGAPARDVRAEPGHEPGDGRRARAVPRPARRRRSTRSRSAGSSATSSSASSRRRPRSSARSTS